MKKKLFALMIMFISIFTFGKVFAATSFPSSIKSKINYDVGYYGLLGTEQGWRLYAKSFSSGNVSQTAFCTSFTKYAPDGITCSPVAWSNNSYNDRIAGAVGAIIYAARDNKSSGAMSWDNYYYAELAINRLLYYGYTDGRGYGSKYNDVTRMPINNGKFNKTKYNQYLSLANYSFNNYGKIKVTITNQSYDASSGKATATVKCTDYKGKGTGCHLTKKQVSYTVDGTNWTTVDATITSSSTISANVPNNVTKLQFVVSDNQCYHTAKNYSCGDGYQSLVPNYLVDSCKTTTVKSPVITNSSYKLEVHKRDADNQPLKGATVKVTKDGANIVEENEGYIELVDGRYDLQNAQAGRYCIGEVKSPEGYKLSEETQCVDIGQSNPTGTIIIKNVKDPKTLTINKVDENGAPVVGAKIKIYSLKDDYSYNEDDSGTAEDAIVYLQNPNGTDYWITDGNPIVISGVDVNKTYTVVEEELPKEGGYAGGVTAQEIVIDADDSKNVVTLTNTHSSIKISKQSVTSTKELPGAKLSITDAQGNEVASWTSSDKPQEITGISDGDYTLTETTAPQGYTVAESVKFTVENGVVKGDDDNTVVMKDATIVEVPDTFNAKNIIAMISGLVLVAVGTGVLFYETKKKKA